jgi:hypothetical protein
MNIFLTLLENVNKSRTSAGNLFLTFCVDALPKTAILRNECILTMLHARSNKHDWGTTFWQRNVFLIAARITVVWGRWSLWRVSCFPQVRKRARDFEIQQCPKMCRVVKTCCCLRKRTLTSKREANRTLENSTNWFTLQIHNPKMHDLNHVFRYI